MATVLETELEEQLPVCAHSTQMETQTLDQTMSKQIPFKQPAENC